MCFRERSGSGAVRDWSTRVVEYWRLSVVLASASAFFSSQLFGRQRSSPYSGSSAAYSGVSTTHSAVARYAGYSPEVRSWQSKYCGSSGPLPEPGPPPGMDTYVAEGTHGWCVSFAMRGGSSAEFRQKLIAFLATQTLAP